MTPICVIYVKLKRRQFIIYFSNVLLYKILSTISLISVIQEESWYLEIHVLLFLKLVLKAYIYRKRCLDENVFFQGLLGDIKTHITTLKYIATKNGRLHYFNKEWGPWLFLCRL